MENRFDFLKPRQKTPANTQSQRGLKSNDYNIPAGGRYKNKVLQDKVHKIGEMRARMMTRFTNMCRFSKKLNNINAKLLRHKIY